MISRSVQSLDHTFNLGLEYKKYLWMPPRRFPSQSKEAPSQRFSEDNNREALSRITSIESSASRGSNPYSGCLQDPKGKEIVAESSKRGNNLNYYFRYHKPGHHA